MTSRDLDWIEQCQHSIGYVGDSFYRSKDPTKSIKVLKEQIVHRKVNLVTTISLEYMYISNVYLENSWICYSATIANY